MKAVVYQEPGKFVLAEKPEPVLEKETDAIVRVAVNVERFRKA